MSSHPLELLALYRELSAEQRRDLDAHLARCAECRTTLAAYQQQDNALRAIRSLQPRRSLAPSSIERGSTPGLARAFSALGGALTIAGLAALIWFAVLFVQAPRAVAAEPGVTLPPTAIHLPSPWLPALPWLAASLLLVALLLIFSRRSLWPPIAGGIISAFLLICFVPPFSALPNPAAVYWRLVGGYGYDPRLPFKNSFIITGQPDRQLQPYLDRLIGQVGLSPLDPNRPLARYEILRVSLHPQKNRTVLVTTRFIYADGTSRIYPVPLAGPAMDWSGFLLSGWRADGLQRLRSEHLALPGQPFAAADSPIRLGPARRLNLHPAASRLDEANPAHWLWDSVRLQRLVWSPDGNAFLCAIELDSSHRQLWLVTLDGAAPILVTGPDDIREYGFSPDGQTIIYTRLDPEAQAADPFKPYAIMAIGRDPRFTARTLATALGSERLPGLTSEGVWFFADDGTLWIAPYDGSTPRALGQWDDAQRQPLPPRPAPDGSSVAFPCRAAVCLFSPGDEILRRAPVGPTDIAWSSDGSMLAVIERDPNNLRPVTLHILGRDGATRLARAIAPRDVTDPPQWTPDGGAVFVQTYPQDGRRIIALDLPSGQVIDLSREHWDAYFALAPDGKSLLLNNGRGDFWLADVLR